MQSLCHKFSAHAYGVYICPLSTNKKQVKFLAELDHGQNKEQFKQKHEDQRGS